MSAPAPPTTKDNEELTRKYKRLESNQKDWAAETQKELKRQQNEIGQLKRDNEQLKGQLNQAHGSAFGPRGGSIANQPTTSAGTRIQKVKEMEHKKDICMGLEQKVNIETRKVAELDKKIDQMRQKANIARENMGGVNITKESNLMIDKQIKVLENRLDKALVKFNEALHINKSLREQIDNLRRERGVFDAIYKKLERELQEKKKEMAFIIEVSNIAYEERDNAQNELAQLKIYASKEMHSFEETFKELDELLEEDRKMKEAIKLRMLERKDISTAKLLEEGDSIKKRKGATIQKNNSTLQNQSQAEGGGDMSPQNYEEAFNKIKAATNMSDINMLLQKFLHSEDDNFSLFNYVNELHNEIEKLEDSKLELKQEIDRIRGNIGPQADNGRKNVLKSLEEKLQREEADCKKYQKMTESSGKLVAQVIERVNKIFKALECDEQKIIESQGTAHISELNIHLYLATIELRTDEYLSRWRRIHGAAEKGPSFPFGSTNISINIPSTGDDDNDGYSDEEERVLTRAELLAKTQQKISKQQSGAADLGRKGAKKQTKKKGGMFPAAS